MARRGHKHDKTGRSKSGDKFVKLFLCTMQSPAWRELSAYAQRLYPWLLLEWDGPRENNNGRISLSVRQAAAALGSHPETARLALIDLQAKGFLVVTRCAALGSSGNARGHDYELTEFGTGMVPIPRKLYRDWKPGRDFPVVRAKAHNPSGKGGFENLESQPTAPGSKTRPQLTGGYTPNLRRRTNEAKNGHFPTYAVGHPYLPGGVGGEASDPVDGACNKPPKAAKPSPKKPESKNFAEFLGEPRTFAVVRGGVPIRVGVRTLKSSEHTRRGDVITATMKIHDLDFRSAVAQLQEGK